MNIIRHNNNYLLEYIGLYTPINNTGQHIKCIRKKIFDSPSVQRCETKYGLRIQFLALVVLLYELWLNA